MEKLIFYHRTWDQNVTLYFWFSLLGILSCFVWLMIDTRLIVNESPSLKPLKIFFSHLYFYGLMALGPKFFSCTKPGDL